MKFGEKAYCTLIPIPVDLTDNMARAIEEAKTLLKANKTKFEEAVTPLTDEKSAFLKDQDGNMLAEIDIDGQKVTVLVNEDGNVLKNTAEEVLYVTRNWATAIGKNIDELVEAPLGYQIFIKNGSKYIRRIDINDLNTPRLMVDETGAIVKYVKPQRLAISGKLRTNLEKILGKAPDNHQAHHIVPSNVVEKSPLHQEAIKKGLYDVDRVKNGKFLAETDEDFVSDISGLSSNYPTHFGSHPNYDIQITKINDEYLNILISRYGTVDKVPSDILSKTIDAIENRSLKILEEWTPPKLN